MRNRRIAVALATLLLLLTSVEESQAGSPNVKYDTVMPNTSALPVPPTPKFPTNNPKRYGEAIAKYMDKRDRGWMSERLVSKATTSDVQGDSIQRVFVRYLVQQEGANGERSIIRFTNPPEVRGVAALIHEHPDRTDENWLYIPSSRKVRRVSGANRRASFQGTEYTYEDIASWDIRRYKWKFLSKTTHKEPSTGKLEPVFKLEAIPRDPDTAYSKLHVYIHREHFRIEKAEYFNRAGRVFKVQTRSRWVHRHGRWWRPTYNVMINKTTRRKTVVDVSEPVLLNLALYPKKDGSPRKNLDAGFFTKRNLIGR